MSRRRRRPLGWAVALLLGAVLAGCATTPPLNPNGVDATLTPSSALKRLPAAEGRTVLWGGEILASTNLRDRTQLEVLGYPLGRDQRPDLNAAPSHRFLVTRPGYLETADFAPGRLVTVRGRLVTLRRGRVGAARYDYPEVAAVQLHLWSRQNAVASPRFHFGVGVIFGN